MVVFLFLFLFLIPKLLFVLDFVLVVHIVVVCASRILLLDRI